jgi:hypothetical protein
LTIDLRIDSAEGDREDESPEVATSASLTNASKIEFVPPGSPALLNNAESTPKVVDFEGPFDPFNPQNWPTTKKYGSTHPLSDALQNLMSISQASYRIATWTRYYGHCTNE